MKKKTKNFVRMVQEALLALPDDILMETIVKWFYLADTQIVDLEWADEYRYDLGYRVQSDETKIIYSSFVELAESEPDGACTSWVAPEVHEVRSKLSNLSAEQFYHTVIFLAGEALSVEGTSHGWGLPPSLASDGYDFMRCLAVYLQYKAQREPKDGHIVLAQEATPRRKKMNSSSASAFNLVIKSAQLDKPDPERDPEGWQKYWQQQITQAQRQSHYRIDSRRYMPRIPYGAEEGDWGAESGRNCGDCGVKVGQFHVPSCDVERCPLCEGQVISCGHVEQVCLFLL